MSPALSTRFKRISRVFSIQTARSLHFLVLVWFLVFIVMHVTFVFTTGLLVNLNHVYAGRTDDSWLGFWLFAASMVIVARRLGRRHAVHHPPPPGRATRRPGDRRTAAAPLRARRPQAGPVHREGHLALLLAQRPVPRLRRVQGAVRRRLRRLPAADQRTGRAPRRARPGATAGATPPRADHPALLHPGLVRRREVGRRLDADASSTSSSRTPRRSGSSSTRSAKERTRASTTTRIRSST